MEAGLGGGEVRVGYLSCQADSLSKGFQRQESACHHPCLQCLEWREEVVRNGLRTSPQPLGAVCAMLLDVNLIFEA